MGQNYVPLKAFASSNIQTSQGESEPHLRISPPLGPGEEHIKKVNELWKASKDSSKNLILEMETCPHKDS